MSPEDKERLKADLKQWRKHVGRYILAVVLSWIPLSILLFYAQADQEQITWISLVVSIILWILTEPAKPKPELKP